MVQAIVKWKLVTINPADDLVKIFKTWVMLMLVCTSSARVNGDTNWSWLRSCCVTVWLVMLGKEDIIAQK